MEDEDSDIEIREEDVIQRARERLKSLSKVDMDTMTERKFRACLAEDFDVDDLDELQSEINQEVEKYLRDRACKEAAASVESKFAKSSSTPSGGRGFTKPMALSAALSKFMGKPVAPRTECVKALWAYIKEKSLQNPKDKRKIILDSTLRSLFGDVSLTMMSMNKYLSQHFDSGDSTQATTSPPPAPASVSVKREPTSKRPLEVKEEPQEKKKGGGGLMKPMLLSPALAEFLGEESLPRTQVVKLLWTYIKDENLQDPNNKRNIKADQKLAKVFKTSTFSMMQMNKLLSDHLKDPELL